ncbi:IS3 family transposase [Kribbella turkmenica]|uniref:IS3 family transposase n=1 Tax=Kribbella turkmenica TaxID=2530375 RepID=UPI00227992F5|nr:IS3 family transposase [Kribbella turkmenica]
MPVPAPLLAAAARRRRRDTVDVRKANCYDNAVIENWFGHLKEELFNHTRYASVEALAEALHQYVGWYNNHRISTQLEGLSPVHYRTQTLAA